MYEYAIAQLEIALDNVKINAPINDAKGNYEQADLERECAGSYQAAIDILNDSQLRVDKVKKIILQLSGETL